MTKWRESGGLTPEGERLLGLHLQGAEEEEFASAFPDKKVSGLMRTARKLKETFGYDALDESIDYVEMKTKSPRILYYDIETTNLGADFGVILMFGYQWSDEEETKIISMADHLNKVKKLEPYEADLVIIDEIIALMEQADVRIGHYSKRFDSKFVQTRAAFHGRPPILEAPEVDTWEIARRAFKLQSNRMANIAEYFGLDEQKSKLPKRTWYNANHYQEQALKDMEQYCMQDVRTQKAMTERIMPYAKNLPGYQVLFDKEVPCCANMLCGSDDVERIPNKFHTTNLMKFPLYKCQEDDCGKVMRGRNSVFDRNIQRLRG